MRIILAFDSFKGSLSSLEACHIASQAIHESISGATVISMPMSDGGEGFTSTLSSILHLDAIKVPSHDALMRPIIASYAISHDGLTAYMEMASSAGLTLIEQKDRDVLKATTYGVGEMILDAARRGCKHIIMGIGGSATCDGGQGMINALKGHLPLGVEITVACDVNNPLYGPSGAAYVFGPQKGADKDEVEILDKRLREFATYTEKQFGISKAFAFHKGAGAAGGLGYALLAYLDARMVSGIEIMLSLCEFEKIVENADCVITGEGQSDEQTLMGKVPFGVMKLARKHGVDTHILSGSVLDREKLLMSGFKSACSINAGDKRAPAELMDYCIAKENLSKSVVNLVKSLSCQNR